MGLHIKHTVLYCHQYLCLGNINHLLQRLLITDVSEHFSVVHIARQMWLKKIDNYIYKMLYSSQKENIWNHAIASISWDKIDRAKDAQ